MWTPRWSARRASTARRSSPPPACRGTRQSSQIVSGPPDGRGARAIEIAYVYRDGEEPPGALRSGVVVPLEVDGEPLGFLAAYSHDPTPRLAADSLARIEAIAAAAGPTIDTARRFREARAAGDHDAVTGLPGRSSFHDALAREVARAHRYERRLALLVLDVDDFHGLNDRLGQLGGDEVLAETAALVRGALREADVAYRAGGDEFAVLLPESARIDAEGLFARVLATVRRHQTGLSLSGGIAELQPDDDALTIYERAEEALHRAKTSAREPRPEGRSCARLSSRAQLTVVVPVFRQARAEPSRPPARSPDEPVPA